MTLQLHLQRPDPVYFAWKRAVNTVWDDVPKAGLTVDQVQELVLDTVERDWECRTIYVHRKHGYVSSVEVEFDSAARRDWFLLRWTQ